MADATAQPAQPLYTPEQEAHIRSIKRTCAHPVMKYDAAGAEQGMGHCGYDVNELVLQSPPGEEKYHDCPGCGEKIFIIGPVFTE